jgi:hypothetical protein
VNTVNKQTQLPNGQKIVMWSDNYVTTQLVVDGAAGTLAQGQSRTTKQVAWPGPEWTALDQGYLSWAFDPVLCTANSGSLTNGTLYLVRVHLPVAASVTNVAMYTTGATVAGLVSGQNFMALYTGAGALVAATADQTTNFATNGAQVRALVGGPFALAAGDYYVGVYCNGTTNPAFAKVASIASGALANINLSAPTLRFATANTGLTTAMPATLGGQTALTNAIWAALS